MRLLLASILSCALVAPAAANITWNWSAGGSHAGQIVTDGSMPGSGLPAAGTYTVQDVSVATSTFLPLGSVANGTYQMPGSAFGTGGPYTITWSGTAVTSIDAASNAGVNGLVIGDGDGTEWAIFGADEFGTHNASSWDFQAKDGRYGFGNDLALAPVPPPVPVLALRAPDGTALVDNGSWSFGTVAVGSGSERTFTITNTGNAALKQLAVTADAGTDFTVTQQPMSTVQPDNTTTFAVTFAPSAGGSRSGRVHVTSNDADSPFDVTLRGTGSVDCVVSDWSAWGPCCDGTQTRTRTVVVPAAGGGSTCPGLTETRSCTVPNPVVTITAPSSGAQLSTGAAVSLAASFTDAGAGTHSGTWSVGSKSATATVTEPSGSTPGQASGTWTFSQAGNYTITLTLQGSCGGRATRSVDVVVSAPVTGFPATPVLDNFNRANGAPGPNWLDEPSVYNIYSKQLRHNGQIARIEWAPAVFGPDQEAYVTWTSLTQPSPEQNLVLKAQDRSWTKGNITVSYESKNSRVVVWTLTPPGKWANRGSIAGVKLVDGDKFGARATRDGLVRVYRNGALLGSVSVAGWEWAGSGGRIGLSWSNGGSTRADDFGGGTVPSTALLAGTAASPAVQAPAAPAVEATGTLALALSNPAPNPTRGRTTLLLALPRAADVELSVLDVQGREVWREPARRFEAGRWPLAWDGATTRGTAPAGVYFARVRAGNATFLRRVAIVR